MGKFSQSIKSPYAITPTVKWTHVSATFNSLEYPLLQMKRILKKENLTRRYFFINVYMYKCITLRPLKNLGENVSETKEI